MNRYHLAWLGLAGFALLAVLVLDRGPQANAESEQLAAAPADKAKAKPADPPGIGGRALAKFMRAKLSASSEVLEGLCTEDFRLIVKGAKSLEHVSHAEQWRVSNDAVYRQHSTEFRAGIDRLLKAAEKKQLDAAALAWTRTTLNCIECHRWVKATLVAEGR